MSLHWVVSLLLLLSIQTVFLLTPDSVLIKLKDIKCIKYGKQITICRIKAAEKGVSKCCHAQVCSQSCEHILRSLKTQLRLTNNTHTLLLPASFRARVCKESILILQHLVGQELNLAQLHLAVCLLV